MNQAVKRTLSSNSMFPVIIPMAGQTSQVVIPEELDGMDGELRDSNRVNLIKVETDVEAIRMWIELQQSDDTKKAYTKETDRLLLWCYHIARKPLSSLFRSDFLEYEAFMLNPPADWCGPRRKRTNPEWRPFVGPLSPKSAKQALIIIKALLSFLSENCYLVANPLTGKLKKTTDDSPGRTAFLPEEWDAIVSAADDIPDGMLDSDTPEAEKLRMQYERGRWLVRLMIGTGLRISEIANHCMGSFQESQNSAGEVVWRFYVVGKGQKKDWIPVSSRLLKALRRYRAYLGLTALPSPSDSRPLIPNVRNGKHITARRLHQILSEIFEKAATKIEAAHPHRAEKLRNASPHVIRHTSITEVGKHADIRTQQAFARHEDYRTTQIYNHTSSDLIHEAVEDANI